MVEEMLRKQNLAQLRAVVENLAARIEAPESILPTYGATEDSARPHIEIDGRYHFVVVERGLELQRRTTTDLDEILYWIFDDVTSSLASKYEVRNRNPDEDFRRMKFGKQLALMAQLNARWAERCEAELLHILAGHPFGDGGDQAIERVAPHHPHTLH
jgi:hypothetical protein